MKELLKQVISLSLRQSTAGRVCLRGLVGAFLLLSTPNAFAACVSPAGNAGDINYSSTQNVMFYCNGTSWVGMGSTVSFGTLTTGDFCTATSGTAISCTTPTVSLTSQVSGILPAANGGTGVNNGTYTVTLGGNLSTAGAFTTSGAYALTLTTTGTTNVTLPTTGTLVNTAVTTLSSLASIGTITTGVWNGTPIATTYGGLGGNFGSSSGALSIASGVVSAGTLTVANGGTGLATLTSNAIYKGNGTGALATSALTDNGTIVSSSESLDATSNGFVTEIANDGTTGTTANKLAKLTTAGAAVLAATTDTDGVVGIVTGGAGTSGNAQIAVDGQASCVFDNTTVAGDFVAISATTAGDCHDAGATRSTTSQTIGRVLASGSAGTYAVALGLSASAGSSLGSTTLGASASATSPQRSGEAGTGLYTAGSGLVDVASTGTQVAEFSGAGINIATGGLNIGGVNGVSYPKDSAGAGSSIAVGPSALVEQNSLTGSFYNTAVGYQAIGSSGLTTFSRYNTAVGYQALTATNTGQANMAIGYQALLANTGGNENTASGVQALDANTTGSYNTANGMYALYTNVAGNFSTAIGFEAMRFANNAASPSFTSYNTAVGALALMGSATAANNTGTGNTALGYQSLGGNTSGSNNMASGNQSLLSNTTGNGNTGSGNQALKNNTTGSGNTASGSTALLNDSTGSGNTAIGAAALDVLNSGSNNTVLGYEVGYTTLGAGNNNILIGTDSSTDTPTSSTSNWLNIGNAIYGYNLYNSTNTTGVPQIGIGSGLTSITAGAVLDLSSNNTAANSSLLLPGGATRPTTGANGMIRYNPTVPGVEAYVSGAWVSLVAGGTGGIAGVPNGGTGDTTLTAHGVLVGEGTSAVNVTAAGATGTVLIGNTGADPTFSASVPLTNLTLAGVETLSFATDYTGTGSQNNVNLGTASSVRYNGSTTATFTGIAAGNSGQILYLHNASTSTLTLSNQSASSTAANEIITGTGSDLVMLAGSAVTLQYDGTAARWRVIGGSGGGIPAGTTGQVQFNSGSSTFAADSHMTWDNTNHLLTVGTGAAVPVATTGTVAGFVMNVIPQAVSPTVGSASGGITIAASTTGQVAYYSGSNTVTGTSDINISGSNVGIGTTTITHALEVNGAVNATQLCIGGVCAPTWSYTAKTGAYTAVAGDYLLVDTSAGGFTITLPTTPAANTVIRIIDAKGTFKTNNLILAPNAADAIMGQSAGTTLNCDISNAAFDVVYTGATYGWRIY